MLGGSSYLLPYIRAAHKLGAYVITCDYLPDNIAHKFSDEYLDVSIIDRAAVLEAARKEIIDGIMSPATDPGVTTCAWVAEQLGLPGCPSRSVEILQHKDQFRQFLRDNHFNAPKSVSFSDPEEAFQGTKIFSFPFMVKPTDSAGSKGVTRVDNPEQIKNAIDSAFKQSISHRILIEDYLEKVGNSSDSDSFSVNSDLVFCSFNSQLFDPEAPNPFTPAAYIWPSDILLDIQKNLRNELQRLIHLLNLGTSLYNIESRMCSDGKGYIMEVSPRAGGNRLSELLKISCGQDLITNSVKAALGYPVDPLTDPIYSGIWAEYILHSNQEGVFAGISFDELFEKEHILEKSIWKTQGDLVHSFTGANQAIGTMILRFESYSEAEAAIRNMNQYVHINLV